jgi:16S rRNA (cytosine967-C5)-methyltransferase
MPASLHVEGRLNLREFAPFLTGHVTVQDESESLVGVIVDALPSHRVLDLCAAPGGKTTHILEISQGMAEVVAVEPVATRMATLRETLTRTGHRARLVRADGQLPPFRRVFDRVLVDAPCTGTGVLARRAEARWRLQPEDPTSQARQQHALLTEAADLVVVGGMLIYSVCSIEPEETTEVVESFVASHPGFEAVPVEGIPAGAISEGRLVLLPGQFGADGVFAARFRRVG